MFVIFLGVFLILTFFCFAYEIYRKKFSRFWKLLFLIPGPKFWPVIGNLFDISFMASEQIFSNERKRSRELYPIFKLWVLHQAVVVLQNPDDVEMVMTNLKHHEKSLVYGFLTNWLGTGLLTSKGEKWQTRRKILTPAFHFNILQDFLQVFNEETTELVHVLKNQCNKELDVVPFITEFALHSINQSAMGTKMTNENGEFTKYQNALHEMGQLFVNRVIKPWLHFQLLYDMSQYGRLSRKFLKSLHSLSNKVIAERERTFNREEVLKKQTDSSFSARKKLAMLDLLLSAKYDGIIDHEGIREEVDTFIFEGHDTTSMATCFSLLLLANHRTIQDQIFEEIIEVLGDSKEYPTYTQLQEMSYLERCIKEVLRLYPSVGEISRVIGEEFTTTTGYTLPKNCIISVRIFDMHRNPNHFDNPNKFDPDRFLPENTKNRHPFVYIPFSGGARNCIGQKFAMIEIKTVLVGILQNFILEPVDKPEDIVILTDLVLRPKHGVKVKLVSRN